MRSLMVQVWEETLRRWAATHPRQHRCGWRRHSSGQACPNMLDRQDACPNSHLDSSLRSWRRWGSRAVCSTFLGRSALLLGHVPAQIALLIQVGQIRAIRRTTKCGTGILSMTFASSGGTGQQIPVQLAHWIHTWSVLRPPPTTRRSTAADRE